MYVNIYTVAAASGPAHALYFGGYEGTKSIVRRIRGPTFGQEGGPLTHFSAGVIAEVMGALVWCPMDVIKQRLKLQRGAAGADKYRGSAHAAATIVREEGVRRGLYKVGKGAVRLCW